MREMHSKRPKFSKFSGGACPRTPLEARALRHALKISLRLLLKFCHLLHFLLKTLCHASLYLPRWMWHVLVSTFWFLIFGKTDEIAKKRHQRSPRIINNCMIPSLYSLNLQPKCRLKFKRIWKLLSLPRSYANARLGGDKMKKCVTHVLILHDIFWIYFIFTLLFRSL